MKARASTPRITRSAGKADTRKRLLAAALHILDEEGHSSLTTTAVARRAGIAQPSFYVHFTSIDDLLHALITEVAEKRRAETREARRHARQGKSSAFRDTFRIPLEDLLAHPQLFRLLLRSRYEKSPLGDWSRAVLADSRRALIEDLTAAGLPARSARERRQAEMIADGIITLTETLALGNLEGRYPNIEEIIDTLTTFSRGYLPLLGPTGSGTRPRRS